MESYAGTEASGPVLSVEWKRAQVQVRARPQLKVTVRSRAEIEGSEAWLCAFAGQRKDRRYYELVEDTLDQGFEHRYFVLTCEDGAVRAIQPFFLLDQDLLAGAGTRITKIAQTIRRVFPRFLLMRTLMVGCAAGEGHLDAQDEAASFAIARALSAAVPEEARRLKAGLAVFKEFTAAGRPALACLQEHSFTRIPSMPMTRRRLNFANFEEYMRQVLSQKFRAQLRRDCRRSAERAKLEMRVVTDATPYIDELYPLYLAVYERSGLKFEKLTRDYFCNIGRAMPDKTLFFLMLKDGKVVSFNMCLKNGKELCSEYVGFDYSVAFDLHLYNVMTKGIMEWAMANRYQWYCSTSLNYEPKYHFRHQLDPLDLYVRHVSPAVNFFMKRALPYLEPTQGDAMLKRFANYADLRGE